MMPSTDAITDPFSERRRSLLIDFANVAGSHDADRIGATWVRHHHELMGARGIFVVEDPKHELILPGDRHFATTGFLRCLMGSTRLLNIQNKDGAREFRYSAPIFCDTNFISFCGTFFSGGDLKANANGFREAVRFLLPIKNGLTANAYVMENADNPNLERVRSSLLGFAALTQAATEDFNQRGSFAPRQLRQLEEMVNGFLESMKGADFRTLHRWVKEFYNWSRLILLKCSLIAFSRKGTTLETRMRELLRFLHEEFARFLQFEIYVAYRFFLLNTQEAFFSGLQRNASALEATVNSMAWDLAHWRTIFDMTMMHSGKLENTPFPVPHFLSFDRPFVRLIETFKLDGVIYAGSRKRCEQIYARPVLLEVSNLLQGPLAEFYTPAAIAERKRRIAEHEEVFDERLTTTSAGLLQQLTDATRRIG
jgi:hypothetical protein